VVGALILACGTALRPPGALPAAAPVGPSGSATVTLGVFDSRAVTIAWVKSDEFQRYMAGLFEERDEAKARGDTARVEGLDAFGPELQRKIHRQGFSTAPVDDILEHIQEQLPAIARTAGVDAIVSKWAFAYTSPSATFVDVTDALVEAFHPSEATWNAVHEIIRQDPVPADQLTEDD
jgi:hypothetical protein